MSAIPHVPAAPIAAADTADSICFFMAPQSTRMAKYVTSRGEVLAADLCSVFDVAQEVPVASVQDLGAVVRKALTLPSAVAVRGRLVDGPKRTCTRRCLHPREGQAATLEECGRRWVAVDVDGVPLPEGVDYRDLGACGLAAIKALPPEFHGVEVVVQATGGHGLKPGARLRLWFWLSRAVSSAELRVWFQGVEAVDHAAFNAAQIIYTAAPVFEAGVDHIPERVVTLEGTPEVEVPELTVPERVPVEWTEAGDRGPAVPSGDLAAALDVVANEDLSWEEWNVVGMAAHAASRGSATGFGAWLQWSAKSSKHDDAACEERWRHWAVSPAQNLGFGTIVHRAQAAVPGWRAPSWAPTGVSDPTEDFAGILVPIPRPPLQALASPSAALISFSEDALALQFAARYGGELCYAVALHRWLIWDGARYQDDARLRHMSYARDICRREANAVPQDDDGLARKLASSQTVAATLRLASSDPVFARDVDDFDADPWLLNTPAGVIDLKTGNLRDHDAGGLFTKVTAFAPGDDCPRWLQFLGEVTQGDDDVIAFLQRFIGYTLTGVTSEHGFLFTYGPGGNGKSLLLNTVAAILGDYAVPAMADVFTAHRNEQHPTHLASLRGARMVVVGETEEGTPWAESRLKSLTGGDRISARVMRGDPFGFTPAFKLWIAGNHRPTLRNPDEAMRRRMYMLPLTFRPKAPDTGLQAALTAEGAGILRWAIDGCLAWQRAGLQPPAAVVNATAEYFSDQDSLTTWLEERCEPVAGAKIKSGELYADWANWAVARGVSPRGDKWFSPAMERHYSKARTNTGMQFLGISIRPRAVGVLHDLTSRWG